jgi:invasion protein IalB
LWEVKCDEASKGGTCRFKRTLLSSATRRPVVTVFLGVAGETRQPSMVIRLPLGIYLPAGASLQVGQDAAKPIVLARCGTSGCYGKYDITAADVEAMLKGADLTITAETKDRKPLQYVVRSEGFPEAYATMR